MSAYKRLCLIFSSAVLTAAVASMSPSLVDAQPLQRLEVMPQGNPTPCTEDSTFTYLNFCDNDFDSGDTSICFTNAFPESLPPGETSLRLLKGSGNFTIVGLWGGRDFFELTFEATSESERIFSSKFELAFQNECGGRPVILPSMCTLNSPYDSYATAPDDPLHPNWTLRTRVNGVDSGWPPIWLQNPSVLIVDFDVTYKGSYPRLPRFVLNFQYGTCPPPKKNRPQTRELTETVQEDLPNTGSASGLLPLAVTLTGSGIIALALRRQRSLRSSVRGN